jgi:hypothetical protein
MRHQFGADPQRSTSAGGLNGSDSIVADRGMFRAEHQRRDRLVGALKQPLRCIRILQAPRQKTANSPLKADDRRDQWLREFAAI